jgi:BatD DUF11 like domain
MVTRRRSAWLALVVLAMATDASAVVSARVDRSDVDLNESLTLEITSDANFDMQPDTSVLDQDFFVGQGTQLSNTTIINGQMERSKTWTFILMPKRAGQLTIPPIALGNERSEPLIVVVSEPSFAPPGEAEIFVTSDVDFSETYVQSQVLLTIKIYRSVPTRQPALRDPQISGAEVLVESAGDDRSYDAIIDGTSYGVVERVYALYPQQSGEIQISPARFEARVLRDGRITGRKVYESEPRTIKVLPVPPPPPQFRDAHWLPARELTLTEDWSRDPAEIKAGEPVTRHVTISALGQLETQIPPMSPPETAGLNIYADKPELSRRTESNGIRGMRKDQYAIIGTVAGTVVLPALELPWWNIEAGEWQVARLPERSIRVLPSGEAAPAPPPPVVAMTGPDAATPAPAAVNDTLWQRATALLAAIWLLTLLAWWWSSRPVPQPREPRPVPLHKQQARHVKVARKAAMAGDGAAVRQAMLEWGRLEWPDDAPRSIGALAARVSSPLADELRRLSTLSYGPASADWDGEPLAKALRSFSVPGEAGKTAADPLPPLMPGS